MNDMSRKEAIEVLKDIVSKPMLYSNFIMGACRVALASLEADEAYQLEYERTTKNDLGVDYISKQEVVGLMMHIWGKNHSGDDAMQECIDAIRVMPSVTPQLSSELEKNSKKLEKNFGESDCISRADARSLICDIDLKHHTFGMSRKVFKDLYNGMDELPSVTPQELEQYYKDLAESYEKTITKLTKAIAEQEPRWIPVSERLPDTDDEVLCWYEYYHWSQEKILPEYGIGCYLRENSAWFGEVDIGKNVRVIAWMPLPKPYESQESEDIDGK